MTLKVPLLWPSISTPVAEIKAIKDLYACLYGVSANVDSWASSLDLYVFSKSAQTGVSRENMRKWGFIAANECVLQLQHLRDRIRLIQAHKIKACPSIQNFIDSAAIRGATRRFDEDFAGIEELRHAVAHAAEHDTLPRNHVEDGEFALFGFTSPDCFTAPHKGRVYELKLTQQTLQKITEIVRSYLGAFSGAAEALEEQGHLD